MKFGLQGLGFWSRGTQTGGFNGPFITLTLLYGPYMSLIWGCTSAGRALDLMNPLKTGLMIPWAYATVLTYIIIPTPDLKLPHPPQLKYSGPIVIHFSIVGTSNYAEGCKRGFTGTKSPRPLYAAAKTCKQKTLHFEARIFLY